MNDKVKCQICVHYEVCDFIRDLISTDRGLKLRDDADLTRSPHCGHFQKSRVHEMREITREFLQNKGFDGLYVPEKCACTLDDLMHCNRESPLKCTPGYKTKAPDDSKYQYYIGSEKGA